jgi:hypothetical protein
MSNALATSPIQSLADPKASEQILNLGRAMLKYTTNGGRPLSNEQAAIMAVYAYATGANPYANELYWMPGKGPELGHAWYQRKSSEQTTGAITFTMRAATTEEANYNPDKGDIAWHVTMHASEHKREWAQARLGYYTQLQELGPEAAWKAATELAGPEPVWTAVGVVYASEKFGGQEKYDRNERAKKRGKKLCLKEGFPALAALEVGALEGQETQVKIVEVQRQLREEPKQTPRQIISELGFDDNVDEGEIIEDVPFTDEEPPLEHLDEAVIHQGELLDGELSAYQGWPKDVIHYIIANRLVGNKSPDITGERIEKTVNIVNRSSIVGPKSQPSYVYAWVTAYILQRRKDEPDGIARDLADTEIADAMAQDGV